MSTIELVEGCCNASMAENVPDTGEAQGGQQLVTVSSAYTGALNTKQQEQHTGAQFVTVHEVVTVQQHVTMVSKGHRTERDSSQTFPANAMEDMGEEPMEQDLRGQEGFSEHWDGGHNISTDRDTEASASHVGSDESESEPEDRAETGTRNEPASDG